MDGIFGSVDGSAVVVTVALLVTVTALAATVGTAAAQESPDYEITLDSAVEIPELNVSVAGTEYPVSSVGRVSLGETLMPVIDAPDGAEYRVGVYDAQVGQIDTENMTGPGTAELSTESLGSGTYFVAVVVDGDIVDVQPFVIQSYEVTLDTPATVDRGEAATVTLTVTSLEFGTAPPGVQVATGIGGEGRLINATQVGPGEYEASVPTDARAAGEMTVYGLVRGDERADSAGVLQPLGGERVILGLSEGASISVDSDAPGRFDDNGDGVIQPGEAQAAIAALNSGDLTPSEAQTVIAALNRGGN